MKEELNALYCYKLDEGRNTLERYVILPKDLTLSYHSWSSGKDMFIFKADFGTGAEYRYDVQRRKLDQFLSSKLYTFNPSVEYALNVICTSLEAKRQKAENEAKRYKRLLKLVETKSMTIKEGK